VWFEERFDDFSFVFFRKFSLRLTGRYSEMSVGGKEPVELMRISWVWGRIDTNIDGRVIKKS
jgi:hypothetical protein